MKKLTILIAALAISSAFSSCKKEYVCKCEKTYANNNGSVNINDDQYIYKDTKPRAIERCDANETTGTDLGGDYAKNCSIQ
jgi:hypothetical protein